jgi:Na+/H+ antiporter NhaA
VLALVWANSPWSAAYENVWSTTASLGIGDAALELDLRHWVNEAAMTIFFLVVGLEITRELTVGEMRDSRSIAAPAFGAVAGMIVPAITYLMFNPAGEAMRGWGIAMSTDTAFVVGVLALLGSRVPDRLRMFLLSLAIVDDICAITVMALFYTDELSLLALGFAAGILLLIACLRWAGVWRLSPYVLAGIALWLAVYESGVHATVAGVLLGLLVPVQPSSYRMRIHAKTRTPQELPSAQARHTTLTMRAAISPNARLQFMLHPWSAFLVVPMFGLANAGIPVNADSLRAAAASPVAIGIAVALVVGKTAGITLGTWIALRSGLGVLPGGLRYSHLVGGAALSGIGFTIALLIANLAFTGSSYLRVGGEDTPSRVMR